MLFPVSEPAGRRHPVIRRLRELRRDRALRDREGVLVAEGVHLVREALAADAAVELFLLSPRLREREEGRELEARILASGRPCFETADTVLEQLQDARSAQPVLALAHRPAPQPDAGFAPPGATPLLVVACGVQDPGNLGAILRSADAAGASACYACGESADPYHPRTVRASMGSIFRMPIARDDPSTLRERLRSAGIPAAAAVPHEGEPYDAADLAGPLALFLGSEGSGLPPELRSSMDLSLRIPMRDGVESLSVAAAAAVLLFEASRQRRGRERLSPPASPAG